MICQDMLELMWLVKSVISCEPDKWVDFLVILGTLLLYEGLLWHWGITEMVAVLPMTFSSLFLEGDYFNFLWRDIVRRL